MTRTPTGTARATESTGPNHASAPSPAPRVLSALVTPYNEDGTIDEGALATLIDFQIGGGADGLFLVGTSGEGLLLSTEERKRLTETALALVAGRVPVVVHCGATDTATAAGLAAHAAASSASALASIPPLFFDYTANSQVTHFATLAEAAPGVDHYVYENPARVGYTLAPALINRIRAEVPQVRGVKDTGDSLARVTSYLCQPDPPTVYTGNNVLLLGSLVMGASGAVSTLANAVPELFAEVVTAYQDGRLADARAAQLTIARLNSALAGLPYIATVKHLLELRGLPGGVPRSPLPALTGEDRAALDARLQADPTLQKALQPVEGV